jgi:hypothetical protein
MIYKMANIPKSAVVTDQNGNLTHPKHPIPSLLCPGVPVHRFHNFVSLKECMK